VSDVAGIRTREVEAYVTRQELAALMGVSVRTIDRMVAAGMPSTSWGRRTRRFKASVALQWARAQERPDRLRGKNAA
jgi:excisionase family DNA binding protein